MSAPLNVEGEKVTLDFYVDQSSVELFSGEGSMSMTNLVFPEAIYNSLSVSGTNYDAKVRKLERIW